MKIWWLVVVCLLPVSLAVDIFQHLAGLKDKLFGGFGKDGNCGCPCRDYFVPKCDVEYVENCYQEHYQTRCEQSPVLVPKKAKEIECQKCRKFHVTVYKPKWFKECHPVFDEKCSTQYHKHCKTTEKCTQIYQTICQTQGYGYQQCEQVPSQTCYPETVCHNTPQTSCHPVRKEKCEKVQKDVPVQKEEHECLPFTTPAAPDPVLSPDLCQNSGALNGYPALNPYTQYRSIGDAAGAGQSSGAGYGQNSGSGAGYGQNSGSGAGYGQYSSGGSAAGDSHQHTAHTINQHSLQTGHGSQIATGYNTAETSISAGYSSPQAGHFHGEGGGSALGYATNSRNGGGMNFFESAAGEMMRGVEAAGHSVMSLLMPFVGAPPGRARHRRKTDGGRRSISPPPANLGSEDVIKRSLSLSTSTVKRRQSSSPTEPPSRLVSDTHMGTATSDWRPIFP